MAEPRDAREGILLALRPKLWRSYRQICLRVSQREADIAVRCELALLLGEGLVDFWDNSMRRFNLTVAGRNAAARVVAEAKRRRAA